MVDEPEKLTVENQEGSAEEQGVEPLRAATALAAEADRSFAATERMIQSTGELLEDTAETGASIEAEPSEAFRDEGMQLYGINYLDQKNPTVKDKIYIALERLDQSLQKAGSADGQQVEGMFSSLTAPSEKGEQVRLSDLLAARDGLKLRIDKLKKSDTLSPDQQIFKRKLDILERHLDAVGGVDMSDEATDARLKAFALSSEKYHRGIDPRQLLTTDFQRRASRAAALEVYGGENAKEDLAKQQALLEQYPQDEQGFRRAMVRESLYGTPIEHNGILSGQIEANEDTDTPIRSAYETLAGYEHLALILSEVNFVKDEAQSLGVNNINRSILLGSAAKGELRTNDKDPQDPSDIDMLMIVSDEDIQALEKHMDGGVKRLTLEKHMDGGVKRLSRSRTASGSTFYIMKRPSVSGKLGETEVMICTQRDFEKQLNGGAEESQTQFVNDAAKEGLAI